MSTAIKETAADRRKREAKQQLIQDGKAFRQRATAMSMAVLTGWVGEERAREAAGRLSAALAASAASARNPSDFYACTPDSVARCVAVSALTGIMPSVGAGSLAYLIPRRPRKDEPPQLNYQLSHRGMNALAGRAQRTMVAIPLGPNDKIEIDDSGEVRVIDRDIDNPVDDIEDLRGIMLIVKNTETGVTLSRNFVAKKLILARRAMSDAFNAKNGPSGPWVDWPIEMAQKTAMHYAIGRGWCVIDDTEALRALTADIDGDLAASDMPVGLEHDEPPQKTLEVKIKSAAAEITGKSNIDATDASLEHEALFVDCEAVVSEHPDPDEVRAAFERVESCKGMPTEWVKQLRELAGKRIAELTS